MKLSELSTLEVEIVADELDKIQMYIKRDIKLKRKENRCSTS